MAEGVDRSSLRSGDTIVVGAPGTDDGAGAAYVFVRSSVIGWTMRQQLTLASRAAGDAFGTSVAIEGHTVLVGAPGRDGTAIGLGKLKSDKVEADVGAAYTYTREDVSQEFELFEQLEPSNVFAHDRFGEALSLSNTTCLVSSLAKYDGGPREGFEEALRPRQAVQVISTRATTGCAKCAGVGGVFRIGWKYQDAAGASGIVAAGLPSAFAELL